MVPRTGGSFGKDGDRLIQRQRPGHCDGLVLSALAVGALDVDGRILVGQPMDQRVPELVLRDKGAFRPPAEHKNVEPAGMIGDDQAVPSNLAALHRHARTDDPRGHGKEARGPRRATA